MMLKEYSWLYLHSGITPDSTRGTPQDAGDRTQVGYVQGKYSKHSLYDSTVAIYS